MKITDIKTGVRYLYATSPDWIKYLNAYNRFEVRIDDLTRYRKAGLYKNSYHEDPKGSYLKARRIITQAVGDGTQIEQEEMDVFVMARFLVGEYAECKRRADEHRAAMTTARNELETAATAAAARAAKLAARVKTLGLDGAIVVTADRGSEYLGERPKVKVRFGRDVESVLDDLLSRLERASTRDRQCPAGPACSGAAFPGHPAH
jgi:hypothetical protein